MFYIMDSQLLRILKWQHTAIGVSKCKLKEGNEIEQMFSRYVAVSFVKTGK